MIDDFASLDLHRITLPLLRPHVAAHGTETDRDVIIAEWRRPDGAVGWGECPTLSTFGYSDEITATAWGFLTEVIGPALVTGVFPVVDGAPMAMGAIRDARLDARLRSAGRSLCAHLGADDGPRQVSAVVGLEAQLPSGQGPVKVKVTPDSIHRLRDIRAEQPSRPMAADANGSFDAPADVPEWIDELDLLYVEQPLAPSDIAGHAALRTRLTTPIALDESIHSGRDLARALDAAAIDVLNIKPARVGGIEAGAALVAVATERGCRVVVGGMLETAVGRSGALALAGLPGVRLPTDLGPSSRYFAADIAEPIELDDAGCLRVPRGAGIGLEPDRQRLAAVTTDRRAFKRD